MAGTIIGIDAHKRSHTAVVLDAHNEIRDQLRLAADRRQLARLPTWPDRWPNRIWAIENVGGLARLLGQQRVGAGEAVVDVAASMTTRTATAGPFGPQARRDGEASMSSLPEALPRNHQASQEPADLATLRARSGTGRSPRSRHKGLRRGLAPSEGATTAAG